MRIYANKNPINIMEEIGSKEPKGSWESFWSGAGIVVTVFAVIGGLLLLTKYIDYEIDIKVNDSAYIKKVSSTIRPSVILAKRVLSWQTWGLWII